MDPRAPRLKLDDVPGDATAFVTIALNGRSIEQLQQALLGWEADIEIKYRAPLVREVLAYVASRYDYAVDQLTGQSKGPHLTQLRAAIAWFAYRRLGRSSPQIGRAMGNRNHTSIMYLVGVATSARENDPAFAAIVDDLLEHFDFGAEA